MDRVHRSDECPSPVCRIRELLHRYEDRKHAMWNPGRPSAVVPPLDGADRRVTLHGHPPPALVKSALTPSGLALPRLHSPVMRESRQYDRRRRVRGTRALQALLAALSIVLAPPVTGAEATPLATLPYSPGLDPDSMVVVEVNGIHEDGRGWAGSWRMVD